MHHTLHALDSITIAVRKLCRGSQKLKVGHVTRRGSAYGLLLHGFRQGPQPSTDTLNVKRIRGFFKMICAI